MPRRRNPSRKTELDSRTQFHSADQPAVDWLTSSVRFTGFSTNTADGDIVSFEKLTGLPADEINARPAQAIRQETGSHGPYRLIVGCQPGRFDIVLAKPPSAELEEIIHIGAFDEALAALIELMQPWMKGVSTLKRVALAPTLAKSAKDGLEAQRLMKRLLPKLDFDPELDRDILWQINRPRLSTAIPQLSINRLSKWQILQIQVLTVGASGAQSTAPTSLLQLDLDINTSAENQAAIASELLPRMVSELGSIAQEIMLKGDIR